MAFQKFPEDLSQLENITSSSKPSIHIIKFRINIDSFTQFELPLMIWFLTTFLSYSIFAFYSFHLEYRGLLAIYKTHQLLIPLFWLLLHYSLFLQIIALLFSNILYVKLYSTSVQMLPSTNLYLTLLFQCVLVILT